MSQPDQEPANIETPFHPALNPSELGPSRQGIEKLEELEEIGIGGKTDLLLVALGEKPATQFTFRSSDRIPDDKHQAYVEAAHAAGLMVEVGQDRLVDPGEEVLKGTDGALYKDSIQPALDKEASTPVNWRTVYVAKTPENLALMKEAIDTNDYHLLGQAFGYPATSTDAYGQKRGISRGDLTDQDPEVLAFADFTMSPDHWQEELQTAERWSNAVKAASLKLHAEKLAQATKRPYNPHANDEHYRGVRLENESQELALEALALAVQAGLVEEAGLTQYQAIVGKRGDRLPRVPEEPATLGQIKSLLKQAENKFAQAMAIRHEFRIKSPAGVKADQEAKDKAAKAAEQAEAAQKVVESESAG